MMKENSIRITLNGELREIDQDFTLLQLAEELKLAGKRFAIERNQEIVPKSTLASVVLEPGDHIEIVQAIGGG